jgi:glycosyltransferase involved in cell wall biosynthesis
MRVIIAHTNFILYWKARLNILSQKLAKNGHELFIVEVAKYKETYKFVGSQIPADLSAKWIRLFGHRIVNEISPREMASALWSTFERLKPDVILATAIAFPTGATAVKWCRSRKRRVIIMDDARMQDVSRPALVNWVKRRIYQNVDAVFIPGPSHAPSYIAWAVLQEAIFFGLDVIDNDWFADQVGVIKKTPGVRLALTLPDKYFLGLGRQVSKKNWLGLIKAYAAYRESCPETPWDLVLVGDGPERPNLGQWIAETELQGVHFYPLCTQEEACAYYALANCLILPSFFRETWGLVVNEAMACGLPVLVSKECGCAESLVREGWNGWTFDPHNRAEMAAALLRMSAQGDQELNSMGQASQTIIAEWPLDRFAEGALAAIESCQGGSRGFHSIGDRFLSGLWKGRLRAT